MVNTSRRVGTEGENRVVDLLGLIYSDLDITRRGGNQSSYDIAGPPVPHEVKRQKVLKIPEWTRKAAQDHGPDYWVLWLVPRDRRKTTTTGHPEGAFVPTKYLLYLLWAERKLLHSVEPASRSVLMSLFETSVGREV